MTWQYALSLLALTYCVVCIAGGAFLRWHRTRFLRVSYQQLSEHRITPSIPSRCEIKSDFPYARRRMVFRPDRSLCAGVGAAMICVDSITLRETLQLLREIKHPKAPKLARKLLKAAMDQHKRDIEFDDGNVSVFHKRQIG